MGSVFVGVDIGSTTAKAVVLNQQETMWTALIPSGMRPPLAGKEVYMLALDKSQHSPGDVAYIIATGYGRVSAEFANKTVTEISCHGRGANYLNPATRTIIDIGGQDSKAISLDERGKVIDFMINDKCASGTGRFWKQQRNWYCVSSSRIWARCLLKLRMPLTSPALVRCSHRLK